MTTSYFLSRFVTVLLVVLVNPRSATQDSSVGDFSETIGEIAIVDTDLAGAGRPAKLIRTRRFSDISELWRTPENQSSRILLKELRFADNLGIQSERAPEFTLKDTVVTVLEQFTEADWEMFRAFVKTFMDRTGYVLEFPDQRYEFGH